MMNLTSLGEFGLIERIKARVSAQIPDTIKGIGDDCAVIPLDEARSMLVTTDSLVEKTHFLRDCIAPDVLGRKSLAVNLSDIAAMGGEPRYFFLSAALPKNLDTKWIDAFLGGICEMASGYNVLLLGGDTTRSDSAIFLNITVIGEAETAKIKYRSTAQEGDLICVTDNLGDSAAGLQAMTQETADERLVERHFNPRPNIAEGQFLAAFPAVHAMLDISDGLNSDLERMREQSHCGLRVELTDLPVSAELKSFCTQKGLDPYEFAALGGEDYCLLATVDPNHYAKIEREYAANFKRPLVSIGSVTKYQEDLIFSYNGERVSLHGEAFHHF